MGNKMGNNEEWSITQISPNQNQRGENFSSFHRFLQFRLYASFRDTSPHSASVPFSEQRKNSCEENEILGYDSRGYVQQLR